MLAEVQITDNMLVPVVSVPLDQIESPEEVAFGVQAEPIELIPSSVNNPPNLKELAYIKIEELLGKEKLSIEIAESYMLRIGSGEVETVLKELETL